MYPRFGFRTLIAICIALAAMLGVIASVQYRWSSRVAVADIRREQEHLETSATLFATRFNRNIAEAAAFVQGDLQSAWSTGAPLPPLPSALRDVYLFHASGSQLLAQRADASGTFRTVATPDWLKAGVCMHPVSQRPLAIAVPLFLYNRVEKSGNKPTLRPPPSDRCFVALLDEKFLDETLVPNLLQQTFGESSWNDYDFAIVLRNRDAERIYGPKLIPDLRKPFFAPSLRNLPPMAMRAGNLPIAPGGYVAVDPQDAGRITARAGPRLPPLAGEGIWELQIAHRGEPLAAAFRHERRRDLLFGLFAELLLGGAIVLFLLGAYRMQRVAEQRMQFVAAISHELRTPVSSISMLSRNQADGLVVGEEKIAQYGELIHQQSRRLSEMIEQTLQYAGIHSNLGARTRVPIHMKAVITAAVDAQSEALALKHFHLEIVVPNDLPAVRGDANLLRIAIDNLLSNALIYAASGRWIGIRAEHLPAEHAILIHVSDHGPGVECSDQKRLFEPFFRGRAAVEESIPGSGIGLSLVRSAAEAHGGSISIFSDSGRGSTFTLRLPT